MIVERPYFVTPHAVARYRERVELILPRQAIADVQQALQSPAWTVERDDVTFHGCVSPTGRRYIAVVCPPLPGREWPAVVTIGEHWRWHEYRTRWQGTGKRRFTADEEQFISDRLPIWTLDAIARHLGRTRQSVERYCWRKHHAATTQDLVTSGQAAALTGRSPQRITALARQGKIRARRKPGGRWWLIDPATLT